MTMNCSKGTVALMCLLFFSSCNGQPDPAASPSPSRTHPVATSTPRKVGSELAPGGGSGGGGSGSGDVGETGRPGRASPRVRPAEKTPGGVPQKPQSPAEWRQEHHFEPHPFSDYENLRGYEEVASLSTQPSSPTNIANGKKLYAKACSLCHAMDGSPVQRDPALAPYNMADLSIPQQYKYGSGAKAVYRSIAFGVPAPPMGPQASIFSPQEMWDITNYIQSIQKS